MGMPVIDNHSVHFFMITEVYSLIGRKQPIAVTCPSVVAPLRSGSGRSANYYERQPRSEAVLRNGRLKPAWAILLGIAAECAWFRANSRSSPSSREIARSCLVA